MDDVLATLAQDCALRGETLALLETSGRRLSYTQLGQRVEHATANLRQCGLRPGDRVLFAVRPGIDAIVLILAVLRAGGVLVAADLGMSESVFAARMALVQPGWCIAESVLLALSTRPVRALVARFGVALPHIGATDAKVLVYVGRRWPGTATGVPVKRVYCDPPLLKDPPMADLARDRPALVVFTSGTTDAPKAVVHTGASLGATTRVLSEYLAFGPNDVAYSTDLHVIVPALLGGARVVISRRSHFSAPRFLADVERCGATHVFGTPSDFMEVVRLASARRRRLPAHVRVVMLGAAPVGRAFLEHLRQFVSDTVTVWCVYAMTEILPVALVRMEEKLAEPSLGDLIGTPVAGVGARLASDGELVVRGPHLFGGYYGQPPVHEHATGDLAAFDERGRIVLLGRKKDMIIRGHHNIYPGLYEPTIAAVPGVRRCSLIGVYSDRVADERIVLVVEPESDAELAGLKRSLRTSLRSGPHCIDQIAQPDAILFARLPLAGRSSKVDKRALLELVRERQPGC